MEPIQILAGILIFFASIIGIVESYRDGSQSDWTLWILSFSTVVVLWLGLLGILN